MMLTTKKQAMMKKNFLNIVLIALIVVGKGLAQPVEQIVKIVVAPDHSDWVYKTGENVKFSIAVFQYGSLIKNAWIRYEIGPEKMDPLNLSAGTLTIDGGTMQTPGFLRCIVTAKIDGKEYRKLATAGFDPL